MAVNANADSAANVNVFHARLRASRVAEQKLERYYAYITICSMFARPISRVVSRCTFIFASLQTSLRSFSSNAVPNATQRSARRKRGRPPYRLSSVHTETRNSHDGAGTVQVFHKS